MLVSIRWLKDYVDFEATPAELADRLTMVGLEVDAVRESGVAFEKVVVAKVVAVRPHPNAEKLSLCEVATGDRTYRVVCGAPNVRPGIVVPFALVGATIPGGYTIKLSRLRGEESEGMLCSEEELEIGDDNTGIMLLPADLPLGAELADALGIGDTVLDVGITPNRADCLSMIGIAREVAAIFGTQVRYPKIPIRESGDDIREISSVRILAPDLCPRYTARLIRNVTVKPSPLWMRQRLEAVGLRAINNIVDITNFVMMEFGQPLHAFDYRFLEEGRIVVRKAEEGERFVSLDGKERVLPAGTLLICDGVKPVAIAGIMGGLNSEVKDDTETVFLESAYFTPSSIRKSARWLGMSTDAAFRFERGIDPEGVVRAANRAAQLMAELGNGAICHGIIDEYPREVPTARDIPLRRRRVEDALGVAIGADEVTSILARLEMQVREDGDRLLVAPPTCRVDIVREIDLIEEVARIYGYDRIPVTVPAVSAMPVVREGRPALEERIREVLGGSGYAEVITYSFISRASVDQLGLSGDDERRKLVTIRNPLTEDQSVMRTTMVYSLLRIMADNARSGNQNLKIYEIGRVFIGTSAGELPVEKNRLGCLLTGARYEDSWHSSTERADFYDMKGILEKLCDDLKMTGVSYVAGDAEPFLHPGRSCTVTAGGTPIGFLGEVHPEVLARMDLKSKAFVCELDLDALAVLSGATVAYREVPKFPVVLRDVAFVVREEIEARQMTGIVEGAGEELLDRVSIFDVYAGKGIPAGMKSLGVRFSYRSSGRTLTDEEVNQVHGRIVKTITDMTGAKIRGEE